MSRGRNSCLEFAVELWTSGSAGTQDTRLPTQMTSPNNSPDRRSKILVLTFLLLCSVVWILVHPYSGMVHDAQLYSLQALANLNPAIFGGDIFLRFGSQDDYTLFPRVYARLVANVGVERAASMVTFWSSLLWLAMGWLIARKLVNRNMACVALGLLASVTAWYGAFHVFRAGESFISARLPAEVVSLAAIAAFLAGRRLAAVSLVLLSALIHPLMTIPVIVFFAFMIADEHWGQQVQKALFPAVVLGGTIATLAFSGGEDSNTDAWLVAIRTRSIFLFPVDWRFEDWQYISLILATLAIAYTTATATLVTRVASSMLLVGLCGLGLGAIAAALPEYPLLLRLQPWRWLWPAVVATIILLPATVEALWHQAALPMRRTTAVLLLTSWLLMDTVGGVLAIGALCTVRIGARATDQAARAMRFGAWLALAAATAASLITMVQCALYPLDTHIDARWVQRMVNALPSNSNAVFAVLATWLLVGLLARTRWTSVVGVVSAATLLVLVMPRAERTWTFERYYPEARKAFEPWQSVIPETAEVLWPNNPTGVWILLGRRSYISPEQLAGIVFSPDLTDVMNVRAEALEQLAPAGWWTRATFSKASEPKTLTPELITVVCRAPGLDYVVGGVEIPGYVARATFPLEKVDVFLYDCHASGRPLAVP